MSTMLEDIKNKVYRLNVLEKIILVNIVLFVLAFFIKPYMYWLELPSDFSDFIVKPWTIITYAFVHYDFLHVLFNMLWLFFIGQLFLNLFTPKMAINIYFLGAICGGMLFILGYTLLPNFFGTNSSLVGASAAVRALLIFLCAYLPSQEVRVFTFNVKLWYIGLALICLDILGLFGSNAGGNLAHLGGALLGYFYAKEMYKGNDIGRGFESMVNGIVGLFNISKKNKGPLKTVHKRKTKVGGYTKADFNEFNNQKKIDVILDKIGKSGYDSLTSEEKEFLFRAGK